MIMELAANGSLDSSLKKNSDLPLERYKRWSFSLGIEYLHQQNILHRDIAARNCLHVDRVVKVSGFGLSRPVPIYNMDPKKNVPIRWQLMLGQNNFDISPLYSFSTHKL